MLQRACYNLSSRLCVTAYNMVVRACPGPFVACLVTHRACVTVATCGAPRHSGRRCRKEEGRRGRRNSEQHSHTLLSAHIVWQSTPTHVRTDIHTYNSIHTHLFACMSYSTTQAVEFIWTTWRSLAVKLNTCFTWGGKAYTVIPDMYCKWYAICNEWALANDNPACTSDDVVHDGCCQWMHQNMTHKVWVKLIVLESEKIIHNLMPHYVLLSPSIWVTLL